MIVTFRIRRDTAANWTTANPVLGLGEPGLETDTRKVKYGDGTTAWNALAYSGSGAAWGAITGSLSAQTDLATALAGKEPTIAAGTATQYWRGDKTFQALNKAAVGLANVDNTADAGKSVLSATKLTTARAINGVAFDGTAPITINAVDSTARIASTEKGAANGVASLGADAKIPNAQLPPLAITSTFVVNSQAAQLALVTQEGDVAVRTDLSRSYIRNAGTAGTMADWNELLTPTDAVLSVNGMTGAVTVTNITGNAGTATTLQTGRTFSISGGGITSVAVSFNGGANVVLVPTLGAITPTSVAATGAVTAATNLRSTVTWAFGSPSFAGCTGRGVLTCYDASLNGGSGALQAYDFGTNSPIPLAIYGSTVTFQTATLAFVGPAVTATAVAPTAYIPVTINGTVYKLLLAA